MINLNKGIKEILRTVTYGGYFLTSVLAIVHLAEQQSITVSVAAVFFIVIIINIINREEV